MKTKWSAIMCCSLLFAVCASGSAYAWALSMEAGKGLVSWEYNYISQMGDKGFFGTYNIDNGVTGGDYASLNGWVGRPIVSGASSASSTLSITVEPTLSLLEAVTVRGAYGIGPYNIGTAPGAGTPMDTGSWRWLYLEANVPWGTLYYGKQRFGYGMKLQFGGSRTEEFLGLIVKLGGGRALQGH